MDLFPNLLSPDALGFHGIALTMPHFFALYPDDIARTRIIERQRELCERIGLKHSAWRPPSVFHITIAEWGDGKRLREPYDIALQKAMERFSFPAFDVALIATARFSAEVGRWAFVLEGDAETARHAHGLRKALADAQQSQGLSAPCGTFRPHLTIAYGANIPEEPLPSSRSVSALDKSKWSSAMLERESTSTWTAGNYRKRALHNVLRYITENVMLFA